ncbi:MAG TPA: SpoIID/LytB domain-containing protein [Coleofasciculaceae cyanobacterium]|jgi:stage II sporulation protein D
MSGWQRVLAVLLLGLSVQWEVPTLAAMPEQVQVRLFEAHPGLQTLTIQGPFEMWQPIRQHFPARRYTLSSRGGMLHWSSTESKPDKVLNARRILLQALPNRPIPVQAGQLLPRRYAGELLFKTGPSWKLDILNTIPAPTYVAIVVGSETQPDWPLEALKAQAVLTQSGLARYKPGDVLGDSTQREVYLGSDYQRAATEKAVQAIWGQALTFQGRPITPYYHASCAGHTSDGRFMSAQPPPYLTGVICPYCRKAHFHQPTRTLVTRKAFAKAFPGPLPVILKTDPAERPLSIQIGNGQRMSGYDFWIRLGQRFGWDKAPGTRFSWTALPNGNVQITSTGAGHGVGLCQHGAAEMARQGKNYREILKFYFPKASLSGWSPAERN